MTEFNLLVSLIWVGVRGHDTESKHQINKLKADKNAKSVYQKFDVNHKTRLII